MGTERSTRYVIFGAGAVGCAVGGFLINAGSRVVFVARPAICEAIRRGLTVRRQAEAKRQADEVTVSGEAVTSVAELNPEPGDVALVTVKSQDTRDAVSQLCGVYGRDACIVCLQNGTRNEEIAAGRFDNVYGGLLVLSTVQLSPEVATLTSGNTIGVGRYPEGIDPVAERLAADLARAGFDAFGSKQVMALKWGKLVANLNNATHAITGYWIERSRAEPEMRALMAAVREEGLRVLDAAGIAVEPLAGERDPNKAREMTERLKRPPSWPQEDPLSLSPEKRTFPSMLQDFFLKRKSNEAEFLNGEIVSLGRKLGMAAPYNGTLLEVVNKMTAEGLMPGTYTPAQLHALVLDRAGDR